MEGPRWVQAARRVRSWCSLAASGRAYPVRLVRGLLRRPLRALQIEVTSRCTRRCAVCLRHALSGRWLERDLTPAVWAAIVPGLGVAEHVHLQGWGEPLLHPELPEMAAAARRAGCSVGITTNGDLLDEAADWLVKLPVDLVTVSVAGGPTRHAALRSGASLEAVLCAAGRLVARRHGRVPRVQLSYLLTRDNADDLEGVVRTAAQCRFDEAFVTHLDCTPSPELLQMAAFSRSGLGRDTVAALDRASVTAGRLGIRLRLAPSRAEDMVVCDLDPSRLAFVSSDGRVGPCAYLLPPVAGRIGRAHFDGAAEVDVVAYGSVLEEPLSGLLVSPARRRFAAPFEARRRAETHFRVDVGDLGLGTPALAALDAADMQRARTFAESPFPPACTGCHKAAGW